MNAIFFLTWVAHFTATVPCKKIEQAVVDTYTGQEIVPSFKRDYCDEDRAANMTKEFTSKEEAEKFMKDCPTGVCSDFKLEEVHQ